MIHIQTKLMTFFIVLILFMNGVAYFLYQGSQDTIRQYDILLERFFLLNEVEQTTEDVYQNLKSYIINKSPELLQEYKDGREELRSLQEQLPEKIDRNQLVVENYSNMIESFLEESDQALKAYQEENIKAYSARMIEAEEVLSYLQETALTLINEELSEYDSFYKSLVVHNGFIEKMRLAVFAFTLFASLLFAFWFSRGITRPIHDLAHAAREIASGKFDGEKVPVQTKDELGFLTETFNSMRDNIQSLVTQIKQKSEMKRLMKEMELKSLQSQVNPHFLFNTLNMIAKTSYIEDAKRTSELIEAVSTLLRHNLTRLDQPTTLQEELKSVNEYMFIQQARFGQRFTYEEDIHPDTKGTALPVLTLQPLVENAFIHGIEDLEAGGVIRISSRIKDGRVLIDIQDNGVGIHEEKVGKLLATPDHDEELQETNRSGHTTGIGLPNIIRRLELFYEREELVTIHSQLGNGTTIRLQLPIEQAEEGYDEVANG
ncbi:histidine kinase [Pontibacillus marinus]|uniref:histidine kinase n=1 Tax=Pontibacillus marinus TaxID=273164 RepID=UPI00041C649A|nr:histidine kinase [Pontibacillus marinus]